jgi:hypothetical protein
VPKADEREEKQLNALYAEVGVDDGGDGGMKKKFPYETR